MFDLNLPLRPTLVFLSIEDPDAPCRSAISLVPAFAAGWAPGQDISIDALNNSTLCHVNNLNLKLK